MPQETGLHLELTIEEELHFFGRLHDLDSSVINERIEFFVNLLQLPKPLSVIGNLSGGEMRRVSLAIALLHKPKLMILDEPTVGVCPLLRQSIWDFLYKLVKHDGVTVVVSTHYTQEASQADLVSVMRHGKLLVEEHPQALMEQYEMHILDNVILQLCRAQEDEKPGVSFCKETGNILSVSYKRRNSGDHHQLSKVITQPANSQDNFQKNNWSLRRHLKIVYALFILQFTTLIRRPIILSCMILVPASEVFFVWGIFIGTPISNLGVINEEQPNCFMLPLNEHKIGCEFLTLLKQGDRLNLEIYASEESALASLKLGKTHGYLVIPKNFSIHTVDRVAFGKFADGDTLAGSSIPIYIDYSNFLRNEFLVNDLYDGFFNLVKKKVNQTLENGGADGLSITTNTGLTPFKTNEKLRKLSHVVETTWADQSVSTCLTSFIMILPAIVGVTLVWDKKRGVFSRTIVCGGSLPHFMMSAWSTYTILFVAQVIGSFLVLHFLKTPFIGSVADAVVIVYGQAMVGLSFGLLVGTVFTQELEVIFCIMSLYMIASTTQGGVTDLAGITSKWVRWYVFSLPIKLPTTAVQNIMFRGWSLGHPGAWSCFFVQGVWILASFLLTIVAYNTRNF
ncbi:ABC transporter G family member 20 isoform X2 [Folsomia candida]|nr:ABC transporter G family member 20 isoform X2 [Folsomia candida]